MPHYYLNFFFVISQYGAFKGNLEDLFLDFYF